VGFSLGEIGETLKARRDQTLDCTQGAGLVSRKLAEVEQKMANLHQLRDFLRNENLRLKASATAQTAIQVLMKTR
jgi:MerR family copper efflux transcriptional regulator